MSDFEFFFGFFGLVMGLSVVEIIGGLDATDKLPPETHREWGQEIRMDQAVVDKVSDMWGRLGLPGDGKPIWK